uniref:Uncharacterized protein n=1 Tax=Anguilla anguilla TaxID=7936 RepID=A0A0E9P758_ANGAN
MQLLSQFTMTV